MPDERKRDGPEATLANDALKKSRETTKPTPDESNDPPADDAPSEAGLSGDPVESGAD
jgi:hypothetical protein